MNRTHRVGSFEKFTHELSEIQPGQLLITPQRRPLRLGYQYRGLLPATRYCSYSLLYGLPLEEPPKQYREKRFERTERAWENEYTERSRADQALSMAQLIVAGEHRLKELRVALPDTEVLLVDRNQQPISADVLMRRRGLAVPTER